MTAYLDHAATTPARPEVVEAMLPWLQGVHGNPSGSHALARAARRAVDDARDRIAVAVGCRPGEVVLVSGGTEADNLAVRGVLAATGGTAVCSAVEHHAVLDPVLASGGRAVGVDARGVIDLEALARALDPSVALVSVMAANNEVGTVQPLAEVAEVLARHAPGAVLHTDAVQALAWLDVASLCAQARLLSISGHKIGGPMGIGALVVRDGTPLVPQVLGGGQERGRRSGSVPVALAVGLGVAAEMRVAERAATVTRVAALRDRLVDGLLRAVPGLVETGVTGVAPDRRHKVAGAAHVCVPGTEAEELLFLVDQDGICASAASSCASGAAEPSHVLAAMGVPAATAGGALRLSLGWTTTDADVDAALAAVPAAVARVREHA